MLLPHQYVLSASPRLSFHTDKQKVYCTCGNVGSHRDKMILCTRCDRWYHTKCVSVSDENFKDKAFVSGYICPHCRQDKGRIPADGGDEGCGPSGGSPSESHGRRHSKRAAGLFPPHSPTNAGDDGRKAKRPRTSKSAVRYIFLMRTDTS